MSGAVLANQVLTRVVQRILRSRGQGALATLPALRHRVHTRTCFREPSIITLTRCKFGMNRRLVRLFALLTRLPVLGPFPQT